MTDPPPGSRQSPIALDAFEFADLPRVEARYRRSRCRVSDNGYAVHVRPEEGGSLRVGDELLPLTQFHFHTPAEHTLFGRRFPMVVHFVHTGTDGRVTVLCVFVDEGAAHDGLSDLLGHGPDGVAVTDPGSLVGDLSGYLGYDGSLTTPPYTEGVRWIVSPAPVHASREQIACLADSTPHNARPLQALGGRTVLRRRG